MKSLFITLLFYYLFTLTDSIETEDVNILSSPKYKHNPVGNIIPGRYIIEFEDTYGGSSNDFVTNVVTSMGSTIKSRLKMSITQDLNVSPSIFRGVSVSLYDNAYYVSSFTKRDLSVENLVLQKLLQENQVKHVYPVVEIPRPKVDMPFYSSEPPTLDIPGSGPPLPFTHSMTQVDQVHSKLGLKGKGIVVGIIDSGIDYRHPALGGGFGQGHLVRYGYDLVGNDFNARDPFSRKIQKTPLDSCINGSGHGTHVAGIIAANDKLFNFTGVAPEVTLGVWRVFSCTGSTSNDIVIQALLDAHRTGCDIINLSLGSPSNWPDDPMSLIANRISEQGTIVVTAAGNDGEEGAFYISSPSTGLKTISVASVDNIYNLQQVLTTEAETQYPYSLSSTTTQFPSGKLVNYFNTTKELDACNGTVPDGVIKGKLVLVQRGGCTFDEKAATAKMYGAIGIVVYDNTSEDDFKPETVDPQIPLSSIRLEAGLELKQLINSRNYTDGIEITFHHALTRQNVTTGYQVSDFSSVGPLYDMHLKPDLAGPGGLIFSTLPVINGGYGILSGTSMATPYITGACALFLEKNGKSHSVDFVKEHFQNYAKPSFLNHDSFIDNPIRQGAGLLQLWDAITQQTHVSPGSISFNDTDNMKPQTLQITNPSNDTIKYKVVHLPSISGTPYDTSLQGFSPLRPLVYTPNASIAELGFSLDEFTLSPGESIQVTIHVISVSARNETHPFPLYGGFIQFVPDSDRLLKPIHVPYIGTQGSLKQLPIFDEKYPFLMPSRGISETGFVLDRSDNSSNTVTTVFRLVTGTSRLVTEILDENSTSIGIFSEFTNVPRNLMTNSRHIFTDSWNGTVLSGNHSLGQFKELDPGYYYLNWKALRLLSDPHIPKSWETKVSPRILIKK